MNGISLGSIYAVIALGYTMVYGIARMLNFAHGDVIMVGGYVAFLMMTSLGLPRWRQSARRWWFARCWALPSNAWPISRCGRRSLAVLITAIGMSYLLQNLALLIWGSAPKSFTSVVSIEPLRLFGGQLVVTGETLVTIVTSAVIMVALTLFVNKTKVGTPWGRIRGQGAAQLMGINVNATISLTFAIGSAFGGRRGRAVFGLSHADANDGRNARHQGFVAAVFGGIGSIPGAMLGGVLLGIIESLSKACISSQMADAIVFGVLIIMLLVPPCGYTGQADARESVGGRNEMKL